MGPTINSKLIKKYLERHAEKESRFSIQKFEEQFGSLAVFSNVLVVPIFDEQSDCLNSIFKNITTSDTLIIPVVNAPEQTYVRDSRVQYLPEKIERTIACLDALRRSSPFPLLIVDRVTEGQRIPPKEGVGLARKIGSDVALSLIAQNKIKSRWIYQTDADAVLPPDYFFRNLPVAGAALFPFKHVSRDTTLQKCARLYELHMEHYEKSLSESGSIFGFTALGSTMVIEASTYAAVRGFPKKSAGEDFYMLNKIRKVTQIKPVAGAPIEIEARLSDRVPFGTGTNLKKISSLLEQDGSEGNFKSYDERCFRALKCALEQIKQICRNPGFLDDFRSRQPQNSTDKAEFLAITALIDLGIIKQVDQINRQRIDPQQKLQRLTSWFDALKTLRFINQMRLEYPDKSLLKIMESKGKTVDQFELHIGTVPLEL